MQQMLYYSNNSFLAVSLHNYNNIIPDILDQVLQSYARYIIFFPLHKKYPMMRRRIKGAADMIIIWHIYVNINMRRDNNVCYLTSVRCYCANLFILMLSTAFH